MAKKIQDLPFERRFKLVDDISETITAEQKRELDIRLDVYRAIRDPGDPAGDVIEGIRARL